LQSSKVAINPDTTPDTTSKTTQIQDAELAEAVKEKVGSEGMVDTSDLSPMELMEVVKQYGAKGKRIAVKDKDGEQVVLAIIPDDVRTYTWKTPEWTWGVMERLLQDCEQAKITFEREEYVDEQDGKKRTRVKTDAEGQHVGVASGWWFDGK
jgi:hypothetical protein